MGISVLLLAYKEAENLKILLPQIKNELDRLNEEYEILVIDAEQTMDNTPLVCSEHGAIYMNQKIPHYAGAFITGIKRASKDKILVLDADGSHNPKDIPKIHEKFIQGNYDLVIGSRYIKGGISNDSKVSFLMSKLLNTTMRLIIGVKAHDISTSYRMYDAKQLKRVKLQRQNYDVLQEVILKMKLNKQRRNKAFSIGEVPITFNKRMFGESKRELFKFIQGYICTVFILFSMNLRASFHKHRIK